MTTKSNEKSELKEGMNKNKEAQQTQQERPMLDHAAYEELMKQLNEAEQKVSQYWDRILRMQAEMENAARRSERDIAHAHKYALEKFVAELLPIIDNLERALCASPEGESAVIEGVNLTLKMLYGVLEKSGIQQVNPMKEPFNPTFHQAISTQPEDSCQPGTVVNVLQKGYLLNDRLIRPALVIVSK